MSKPAIKRVLTNALARIRQGWTQGVMARDKDGLRVCSAAETACAWCLVGAVTVGGVWDTEQIMFDAHQAVADTLRKRTNSLSGSLSNYNDNPDRTVGDIESLLVETIEAL